MVITGKGVSGTIFLKCSSGTLWSYLFPEISQCVSINVGMSQLEKECRAIVQSAIALQSICP